MSEGLKIAWVAAIASILAAVLGAVLGRPVINEVAGTTDRLHQLAEDNDKLRAENSGLKVEIEHLKAQLRETQTSSNESGSPSAVAEQPSQASPVSPAGGGPSPTDSSVKLASWPSFETESYRLIVEDMKKAGTTVRVTMLLEVLGERGLDFHAGGWRLIDENGEQWSELSSDSPSSRLEMERAVAAGLRAPFRDKIHLVSGTRVKDSLVFSAMGSGQGIKFTLIGVESDPQPRREIVLRGLVAGGD